MRIIPFMLIGLAGLSACRSEPIQRSIVVTSEPSGARVWVNDVEIGRTPAETAFKFYGTYDVRLELEGYEPVHEGRVARAPLHEQPGLDLFAQLSPFRFSHEQTWHFDLAPEVEQTQSQADLETGLVDRAIEMRRGLGEPVPQPADSATEDPDGESSTEIDG